MTLFHLFYSRVVISVFFQDVKYLIGADFMRKNLPFPIQITDVILKGGLVKTKTGHNLSKCILPLMHR